MWLVNVALVICFCHTAENQRDYGPYNLTWQKIETCKGPKQADCGNIEIGSIQNIFDIVIRLDFPKDCPVSGGKIVVSTLHNNKTKSLLWNYAVPKPCQHFVLGPILSVLLNVTKECKVSKGLHVIHLNLAEETRKFLGPKFFYGTFVFKTLAYNKNSNFFCFEAIIDCDERGCEAHRS